MRFERVSCPVGNWLHSRLGTILYHHLADGYAIGSAARATLGSSVQRLRLARNENCHVAADQRFFFKKSDCSSDCFFPAMDCIVTEYLSPDRRLTPAVFKGACCFQYGALYKNLILAIAKTLSLI
jgi:hypothetical protein